MPSFQRVLRRVVSSRSVASVKKPVCPDLANALYDEVGFVLPHARYGYPTDIEIDIFHPRIFSLDRFHEYRRAASVAVVCRPRPGRAICTTTSRRRGNCSRKMRGLFAPLVDGDLCSSACAPRSPMMLIAARKTRHTRARPIGVNIHIRVSKCSFSPVCRFKTFAQRATSSVHMAKLVDAAKLQPMRFSKPAHWSVFQRARIHLEPPACLDSRSYMQPTVRRLA